MSEKKINFFIVGAQKSATTSLYYYLKEMTEFVELPLMKEVQLFSDDVLYNLLVSHKNSFYRKGTFYDTDDKIIGLADVNLLYYYQKCAERIYHYNPKAKIIILLRNPIERAYSSYLFSRKNMLEDKNTFEEAIAEEDQRMKIQDENKKLSLVYLHVGLYAGQVRYYINRFGNHQVKILIYEEFIKNKRAWFNEIIRFLNVNPVNQPSALTEKNYNPGGIPKIKIINFLIFRRGWFHHMYVKMISLKVRIFIRRYFISPLFQWNVKAQKFSSINPTTCQNLKKYYQEDITQLSTLIHKNLNNIWFNTL